jgi:hypothetical protein
MGAAYIRFFAEYPEYLRFLFMNKDINNKIEGCSSEAHFKEGHPFSTFYKAVSRYKASYPDEKMDTNELVLVCWGLVHGLATLLVNGALPNSGDNLLVAEKIIRSGNFLNTEPRS